MTIHFPTRVTFRGLAPSEGLEGDIRRRTEALGRIFDRIVGARIVVEARRPHGRRRRSFHVGLQLAVPRRRIITKGDSGEHDDPRIAVREAFEVATRHLENRAGRLRRR
jgi:hypothetical protein